MKVKTFAASLTGLAVVIVSIAAGLFSWNTNETQGMSAFVLAGVAFSVAVYAHFYPETPGEPVALGATFTALALTLMQLLNAFKITHLTAEDIGKLISLIGAVIAVATGMLSRGKVWSERSHVIDVSNGAVPEKFAK